MHNGCTIIYRLYVQFIGVSPKLAKVSSEENFDLTAVLGYISFRSNVSVHRHSCHVLSCEWSPGPHIEDTEYDASYYGRITLE